MKSYSLRARAVLTGLALCLSMGCDEATLDDGASAAAQLDGVPMDAGSHAADARVVPAEPVTDGGVGDSSGKASPECVSYCADIEKICVGELRQFADDEACLRACAAYPTNGAANAMRGNSLQCRVNHIQVNVLQKHQPPATHCPHAGPTGGGACK